MVVVCIIKNNGWKMRNKCFYCYLENWGIKLRYMRFEKIFYIFNVKYGGGGLYYLFDIIYKFGVIKELLLYILWRMY